MTLTHGRIAALTLSALLLGSPLLAQEKQPTPERKAARESMVGSFGVLESMNAETAHTRALDWLKEAGKTDEATQKACAAIWSADDHSVVDKVADTFALGDPEAARLMAEARDVNAPAPTETPAVLKDTKKPVFFRANLALAYGKALCNRRVFEEALESLRTTKVEDVVDPGAYLFHRAVAEHALLLREDATRSILRLLDDVVDAPERYKMVAALMHFDMLSWREKDLGWVARMMNNIERRLDLERGGKKTQDMEQKVVLQLDEMIKKLEEQQNQQNQQANANGQGKSGTQPNNNTRATSPQNDSYGGNGSGPGNVDPKKLKELAEVWGKLPEKEREKAMLGLVRDMPPRHRELIENYFKNLARSENNNK